MPKANQAGVDVSSPQLTQMQTQINQLSQMMSMFVGSGSPLHNPGDAMAGMVTSSTNLVFPMHPNMCG